MFWLLVDTLCLLLHDFYYALKTFGTLLEFNLEALFARTASVYSGLIQGREAFHILFW